MRIIHTTIVFNFFNVYILKCHFYREKTLQMTMKCCSYSRSLEQVDNINVLDVLELPCQILFNVE